jgi:hypothetical protein
MAYYPRKRNYTGKLTVAQINAGITVVAAEPGLTIKATDFYMKAIGGAVGAVTTIDIKDTAASPVTVGTCAQAQLTENAILRAGATGTVHTNLGEALTAGKGLQVVKNGSDITTATHVIVCIDYIREG